MILKEENMKNKKSMFLSSLHLSPYTLFYTRFYYNHSSLYSFYVDTTDTITQLQEQIARMGKQIGRLQHATHVDLDPQVQGQVATTIYHPSEAEANRYPPIRPSD